MIEKVIKTITWILTATGGMCLLLMMLQMVIDVGMTHFFKFPIEGNLEVVSYYYMVGVVFLPLGMVELRNEHISVDLFIRTLPKVFQNIIYIIGCVISASFFVILTYQTFLDAINSTKLNEVMMGSNYVTIWPSRWFLPIGFTSLCLCILLNAWYAKCNLSTYDPNPSEPDF